MDTGSTMASINWLGVTLAAISMFVLGGLWFGPLFGKAWMRGSGMTGEQSQQGNPGKIFGVSFVLVFLAAVVLDMFLGPEATLGFGMGAGFSVGLFWVGTMLGVIYLFEHRPLLHWLVNAGYSVMGFTLMGAILAVL